MLLKNYVPFFIADIKEMQNIYNAQQKEIDKLNLDVKDLKAQCFVNTATWGLKLWEEFVGINTDISKSIEERRANVLAKLRGQGTTTKKVIEEIAQAYVNKAKVIEYNKESYFTVDLENINRSFNFKLDDLYNIIEEIQPAHLEAKYKFISAILEKVIYKTCLYAGEEITVYPYGWKPKQILSEGIIKNNATIAVTERITIYPRGGN